MSCIPFVYIKKMYNRVTPAPELPPPPLQVIKSIAQVQVDNCLISKEEAKEQVNAIDNFFKGKLSYAEMRAIAG